MDINRELAIKILKYLDKHKVFNFPFLMMNQEYTEEDDDFVEIEPNEWEMIEEDDKYQTFQLWENLQNLDEGTLMLMAKGFIDLINNESLESSITDLEKNYKKESRRMSQVNKNKIEDYELCEFIRGKAEAYNECLELIKNRP